jgi:hypothetical protein
MSAFDGLNFNGTTQTGQGRVQQAIATASRRTGVDFSYLMGQARIESAMNPTARAQTSSATGLFQFIDQSWLAAVNNYGSRYGMDWAANAIQKSAGGQYYVSDPQLRHQILDLRNHPETASVMAAELASDNRDYLMQQTGREPQAVDLYLAHFLGAGGAAKFLNAMASAPGASGASLFPAAARANGSIFYDREGNARSLADIRSAFAQKLAGGGASAFGEGKAGGDAGAYQIPEGARTVLPADYLRISQALQGLSPAEALPAMADASQIMAISDPDAADGTSSDGGLNDIALLQALQARTLGRSTATAAPAAQPAASTASTPVTTPVSARSENARLAYLMLATLGR